MKTRTSLLLRWISVACVAALVPALVLSQGPRGRATRTSETGLVRELVMAVPFHLEEAYVHAWRKDSFPVHDGLLLVLAVDPEVARARETAERVLCVGMQTAERVNHGGDSGRMVVIVPMPDAAHASAALAGDLAPVWFAAPELPERVDADWIAAEWTAHDNSSARAFDGAELARAAAIGGSAVYVANRAELDALAAELVVAHAPEDVDLASRLKAPLAR